MGSRFGCPLILASLTFAILSACSSSGISSVSEVSGTTATAGANIKSGQVVASAPTPTPAVNLSAQATTVDPGTNTLLSWTATDATSCTASGGWSGSMAPSGTQMTAALTTTTSFTLTCTGAGGTATQSITVTVASPAPRVNLSATPASIAAGANSTVTWTTSNATACSGSGAWTGSIPISGSQSTGPLTTNSTYTLSCTGPGGTTTQSEVVSVAPAVPTVSLGAVPSTVVKGSSGTLSWVSTNATACVAGGSWSGSKPLAGSQSTGNLSGTGNYSLTCTGPGGTAKQSTTVTVAASSVAPTVSLSVGPSAIVSGGSSTITWSATNANYCTASGAWSGSHSTHGSESTGALTASASYTMTCFGAGGTAAQTATVSVTAAPPAITFSANPITVKSGTASSLTWAVTNSDVCTASGAWTGAHSGHGTVSTGPLTSAQTYTITCVNSGGSAAKSVTVSVEAATPTVTLTTNPTTVKSGGSAVLSWNASNATSCAASGGWTGAEGTSGSQTTVALRSTTQFTLTCTGSGGYASQSATVTVAAAPPSVSLTANPTSIASGSTAMLTWSSTNATACTASGGWSGALGPDGSRSTAALTAATTYTISCSGSAGSATQSATVQVAAATPPSNGTATLTWTAPTMNTDGSPVTPLSGYTIYYGTTTSSMAQSVVITGTSTLSYEFTGLTSGTWYFAIAADAADGSQSAKSIIGSKTI